MHCVIMMCDNDVQYGKISPQQEVNQTVYGNRFIKCTGHMINVIVRPRCFGINPGCRAIYSLQNHFQLHLCIFHPILFLYTSSMAHFICHTPFNIHVVCMLHDASYYESFALTGVYYIRPGRVQSTQYVIVNFNQGDIFPYHSPISRPPRQFIVQVVGGYDTIQKWTLV